jgi:peptidoglycan/LPS O-acetylase OafA/YrhL
MRADLLPGVHGLRTIAVVMIVLFHLHGLGKVALPETAGLIASHFGFGVPLFFVLSAFSLMYSTAEKQDAGRWVKDYLLRRFFRIAPLFYAMLLFYILFWPGPKTIRTVLLNATFVFNLVPGKQDGIVWASWTIGVEMIFYALLPIVILVVRSTKGFVILCIVSAAVSHAGRAALENAGGELAQYATASFISNLGIFAEGLLAYALFKSVRASAATRLAPSPNFDTVLRAALIVGTIVAIGIMISPLAAALVVAGRPDALVWGLIFASATFWQARYPSAAIANRYFVWIGERSYSAYLLHPVLIFLMIPVYSWIANHLEAVIGAYSFFVCATLTFAMLFSLSAITYRFIERPGMDYGRRLIARQRLAMAAVPTSEQRKDMRLPTG